MGKRPIQVVSIREEPRLTALSKDDRDYPNVKFNGCPNTTSSHLKGHVLEVLDLLPSLLSRGLGDVSTE